MAEKKRRQGQTKPNGKTAVSKPLCPTHGKYLKRIYTREKVNSKWQYVPAGWCCPSSTCDYVVKDLVELVDDEEDNPI